MLLRSGHLGLDFLQQAPAFALLDAGDVVLVLQNHADRVGDRLGIERDLVEFRQGARPVDRLGNAGRLEEVEFAQFLSW